MTDLDDSRTESKPAVAHIRRLGLPTSPTATLTRTTLGAEAAAVRTGRGRRGWCDRRDYDGALHGALAAVASRDQAAALKRLRTPVAWLWHAGSRCNQS